MRLLIFIVLAAAIGYLGATVPLGNKTLFGHIRAIWHSEQAQDLKKGVQETAGPAVHRVEHGIEQGYRAMREDNIDAGVVQPEPHQHVHEGPGSAAPGASQ